ncbi:hypothetical protein NUW58_g3 [Xylaria curta]|uniref:Uncharacterized protein n=1 Tax=Xylaria curta TaxID=42375 RepID=A0ACC1PU67_9PEZI|nr:hypothetical protein NUW58_g3 [Xylaria curta]
MAHYPFPAVNAALHRLLVNEDNDLLQEHRVASFVVTLLHHVFQKNIGEYHWIFTPEQRESDSNRIPDYSVEAIDLDISSLDTIPWLNMEFKKRGGTRTYSALHQLVQSVAPSLNDKNPARYLVVVAGTKISFWELDRDTHLGNNDNNQPPIEHLWGCKSLLQPSIYPGDSDPPLIQGVTPNYPRDILEIYNDDIGGRTPTNNLWKEALKYHTDALFDLENPNHGEWIVKMFEHIATRPPASFINQDMEEDHEMEED